MAKIARVILTAMTAPAISRTPVGGRKDLTHRNNVVLAASLANAGSKAKAAFDERISPVYNHSPLSNLSYFINHSGCT